MSEEQNETSKAHEYKFVETDRELRCFIFEAIVTYTEKTPTVADMDDIYRWVAAGEKRQSLKAVK